MRRGVVFLVLFVFSLTLVFAAPIVEFTDPTPSNATRTTNASIEVNVSVVESNLRDVIYNWNGTNYSLYDNDLILHLGINNNSNIGDNLTYIIDVSLRGGNGTIRPFGNTTNDTFESGVSNWASRDGNWQVPTQDCTTASSGSCSINTTETSNALTYGSIFINTLGYPAQGSVIEFDYKCENSDFKWGIMLLHDGATWKCIQGTGDADCGGGYTAMGALNPAITCDSTWRHANYTVNWGTGTITQSIIGNWGGANAVGHKLWFDNFNITKNPRYIAGEYGMGMDFNGITDYVITGNDFSDLGTDNKNYTFSLWFNAATGETDGDLIHMSSLETGMGWCLPPLAIDNSMIKGVSYTGATVQVYDTETITAGTWYHVVNTWDTSGLKLYVNGILKNTTAQATYDASDTSNFIWLGYGGGGCVGDEGMFNGTIDEVRIWNRSLTSSEIYQEYVSNLNKHNSTQWYLYVNQSKNATAGLDNATYTYQTFVSNTSGSWNNTGLRTVEVRGGSVFPLVNFTDPTPVNNTETENTSIEINVSVVEANLKDVVYNWNGTNYTIYNDSLKIMFNFDNVSSLGENSTYAVDLSGNRYNATMNGSSLWNSSGRYGGTFRSDGAGDFAKVTITRAQEVDLGINVEATISVWINSNNPAGIGKHRIFRTTLDRDRYLTLNNGTLYGYQYNGPLGGNQPVSYNFSNYTGWNHVGFYYNQDDGSNQVLRLYINGIMVNETTYVTTTAVNNGADYYIGAGTDGSNFFNGSIDEFMMWNRSLTADEIYQQYISNLKKYNTTQWYLYMNQSKNSTAGLSAGSYTYQSFASNSSGSWNSTELRTITISGDLSYPVFFNFSDNNNTLNGSGVGLFNVSINNTNGTVLLEINSSNYTATNISGNLFNASFNFTTNGTYSYKWHAYGNGSSSLFNSSSNRSYFVGPTAAAGGGGASGGDSGASGGSSSPVVLKGSPSSRSSGGSESEVECVLDSDCDSEYTCYSGECVKLFDVEILDVSPLIGSLSFELEYLIKGMANFNDDVVIKYWIENSENRVDLGQDTIYLGSYEEKVRKITLNLPNDVLDGSYDLHVQVGYENYNAGSFRKINTELLEKADLSPVIRIERPYVIYVVILVGGFVLGYFAFRKRKFLVSYTKQTKDRIKGYGGISQEIKHVGDCTYLSEMDGKLVYSSFGKKLGYIREAVVSGNAIVGWIIKPAKRFKLKKTRVLIKYENVKSVKNVVIVDGEVGNMLKNL